MTRYTRRQQARPARSPDYRISIAGRTISPEMDARLISLTLTDKRGFDADQLDITLTDHDGRLKLPDTGAELRLALGWRGEGLVDRGIYIVDEIEHSGTPDQLVIRARAADMRKDLPTRRSQSWHKITLRDIIATIASRHGLEPRVNDTLADTLIEHIDQTDESDLHFLTRLGERFDADATIKIQNLLFLPRGAGETAGGIAIPPVTLTRQAGDSHRYLIASRDTYSGVVVWWHDPEAGERYRVQVGTRDNPKYLRGNRASEADAMADAQAEWRRVRRAGASLALELAEGRPDLYPETPVVVRGWKPEIDGADWVVAEVSHSVSDSGYTCSVICEFVD